ncbi:hypothetical protein [Arthrobacter sp. KBS0703]|nr:hypothetical protein [Arthrobacter sp. KBS0703]
MCIRDRSGTARRRFEAPAQPASAAPNSSGERPGPRAREALNP